MAILWGKFGFPAMTYRKEEFSTVPNYIVQLAKTPALTGISSHFFSENRAKWRSTMIG